MTSPTSRSSKPLLPYLTTALHDEPPHFVETVRGLRDGSAPPERDAVMAALLELRGAMQRAGDEAREARALDALDWLVGWCGFDPWNPPAGSPFGPAGGSGG